MVPDPSLLTSGNHMILCAWGIWNASGDVHVDVNVSDVCKTSVNSEFLYTSM